MKKLKSNHNLCTPYSYHNIQNSVYIQLNCYTNYTYSI